MNIEITRDTNQSKHIINQSHFDCMKSTFYYFKGGEDKLVERQKKRTFAPQCLLRFRDNKYFISIVVNRMMGRGQSYVPELIIELKSCYGSN